jgi:flagellar hook protein FlgE
VVNNNASIGDIFLPVGTLIAPNATKNEVISGNLPADAAVGTTIPRSTKTYDAQGNVITLTTTFTKTASGYDITVSDDQGNTSAPVSATFGPNGLITSPTSMFFDPDGDGVGVTIDVAGLTYYTGNTTVNVLSQDGTPAATLSSFTINPDGQLIGIFSNGVKQTVAQLALANFNNPPGLEKTGDALYRFTVNSGLAQINVAGTNGLGVLQAGAVEMSNVDLAQEFTNLIIAQRGFEANSKVISTSDELLQDLVNLKR